MGRVAEVTGTSMSELTARLDAYSGSPLDLVPLMPEDELRTGGQPRWVRTAEGWRAEVGLVFSDARYHAQYDVDLARPLILGARATLLLAASLLAGCAAVPQQDEERPKDVIKDPARIHGFFLKMIREDKPGIAAQVTSIGEEALTIGVRNRIAPDLTRRILLGFEQHDLKVSDDRATATARWCNREFGLSRDFQLRSEAGGRIWKLQITREQIEELANAGLGWFRKQREVADGRIYAYPPDWVPTPVSPKCPCEQAKIAN